MNNIKVVNHEASRDLDCLFAAADMYPIFFLYEDNKIKEFDTLLFKKGSRKERKKSVIYLCRHNNGGAIDARVELAVNSISNNNLMDSRFSLCEFTNDDGLKTRCIIIEKGKYNELNKPINLYSFQQVKIEFAKYRMANEIDVEKKYFSIPLKEYDEVFTLNTVMSIKAKFIDDPEPGYDYTEEFGEAERKPVVNDKIEEKPKEDETEMKSAKNEVEERNKLKKEFEEILRINQINRMPVGDVEKKSAEGPNFLTIDYNPYDHMAHLINKEDKDKDMYNTDNLYAAIEDFNACAETTIIAILTTDPVKVDHMIRKLYKDSGFKCIYRFEKSVEMLNLPDGSQKFVDFNFMNSRYKLFRYIELGFCNKTDFGSFLMEDSMRININKKFEFERQGKSIAADMKYASYDDIDALIEEIKIIYA